ncbi:MAG: hypothetical protein V4581_11615 [Bacteroidota bacterium]
MSYTKKYIIFFLALVVADFICIASIKYFFHDETYTYIAIGAVTALMFCFVPKKTVDKQSS